MMGIPLQCSAFLNTHRGMLQEAHGTKAKYLFQATVTPNPNRTVAHC